MPFFFRRVPLKVKVKVEVKVMSLGDLFAPTPDGHEASECLVARGAVQSNNKNKNTQQQMTPPKQKKQSKK